MNKKALLNLAKEVGEIAADRAVKGAIGGVATGVAAYFAEKGGYKAAEEAEDFFRSLTGSE